MPSTPGLPYSQGHSANPG